MKKGPMNMTKFLEHKDIYLRPQQEEDAAFFYTWNNDALTRGKIGEKRSKSLLQIQQSLNKQRSDSIWFSVVKKDSDEVIGETGFLRMDPDNGCSDFSIILPYAAQQHKGYGKQVVELMFAYALAIFICIVWQSVSLISTQKPYNFINGLVFNRKASMKKAIIMISNIMILS